MPPATRVRRRSTASSSHPALELYALGSDTLAGRSADALDPRLGRNGWSRIPRFITNEAALSCGADVVFLCLSHEEAAAIAPPARGVVVDLSGAHRFRDPAIYESWYGFEHPGSRVARVLVVRPSGGEPAHGTARREPGLLRDGGAARARADPRPDRARRGLRRREVGDDRRGPLAEADLARRGRARERRAVRRRRRTATRPRSPRCSASPSRSCRICCPSGAA